MTNPQETVDNATANKALLQLSLLCNEQSAKLLFIEKNLSNLGAGINNFVNQVNSRLTELDARITEVSNFFKANPVQNGTDPDQKDSGTETPTPII